MKLLLSASAFALCFVGAGSVWAQQSVSSGLSDAADVQPSYTTAGTSCNLWEYQAPTGVMSFQQRACFQLAALATPYMALRGAMVAGMGDWRDNDNVLAKNRDTFAHRYATFYARHSAQAAGELVAGYFNREDPRPRTSLEHGNWNRARGAIMSVLRVQDAKGQARMALTPLAGSFSSGIVGMAMSPNRNDWNSAFTRTGLTYSTYFASALAREFKPDLYLLANHLLHKKKQD